MSEKKFDYFINGEKDRQQFQNNIDKWNLRKNLNQYDIVQYALNYCMIDCEVLMNGYMKFREWMKENFLKYRSAAHALTLWRRNRLHFAGHCVLIITLT